MDTFKKEETGGIQLNVTQLVVLFSTHQNYLFSSLKFDNLIKPTS